MERKLVPWKSETIKSGQKYGRYTILSLHKVKGTYKYLALCQCDCGSEPHYVQTGQLRNGDSGSCGCLHRERVTKHGAWNHPLFARWVNMMDRCYDPKCQAYSRYGGRGITVCEQWHNVQNFIADMFESYKKGLQLERIDNNKGYSKENCCWATPKQQSKNRRSTVFITFQGKTLCMKEWAHTVDIPFRTLWQRLRVLGWDVERAFTTPPLDADTRCALARAKVSIQKHQ